MESQRPPRGSGGGTEFHAVLKAREHALRIVEVMLQVLESPDRHSGAQVSAAKLLLDVAGVGALLADERHSELLRLLRKHCSAEAYGEVIRALADHTGASGERAAPSTHN